MSITIRDLAEACGVSIGTVSRALKNQPGLTAAKRALILGKARDLGYDTDRLRTGRIKRLVFLLHRQHSKLADNPFFSTVLHGVEAACREQSITPTLLTLGPADPVAELVLGHNPDALLVAGFFEPELLEVLAGLGKPIALIDSSARGFRSVNPDNVGGSYQLTRHLIGQGCRRIGFLAASLAHYSIHQRQRGYRRALYECSVLSDPELEVLIPTGMELVAGIEYATRQLLELPRPADSIFAYNDNAALIAMRVCQQAGLRVPHDICIAGFDDIGLSQLSAPALTSLHVDQEALGRVGVELLLQDSSLPAERLIPAELVVRESTHRFLSFPTELPA